MRSSPRPLLWILLCVVGLLSSGCRLEVAVTAQVAPDGTGLALLEVTADAALAAALPPGAELLIWDDARAEGWEVTGPEPTEDGGLRVRLQRPFTTLEGLAEALGRIGPFLAVETLSRTAAVEGQGVDAEATEIRTEMRLRVGLADGDTAEGFAAFSDPDLDALMGGPPFGEELAASGATPATAMGVQIRLRAPGDLERTTGTVVEGDPGSTEALWQVPLDGSFTEVVLVSVQRPAGASWADALARVLSVLTVVWVAAALALLALVAVARQRRARRRRRHSRLGRTDTYLRS